MDTYPKVRSVSLKGAISSGVIDLTGATLVPRVADLPDATAGKADRPNIVGPGAPGLLLSLGEGLTVPIIKVVFLL